MNPTYDLKIVVLDPPEDSDMYEASVDTPFGRFNAFGRTAHRAIGFVLGLYAQYLIENSRKK
jgi:hypothetical protein